MAKGESKNNPGNRSGESGYKKTASGKLVRPVLYLGRAIGHGKYMAGEIEGKFVTDSAGRPIPYREIDGTALARL
jgi:hypothetical protein